MPLVCPAVLTLQYVWQGETHTIMLTCSVGEEGGRRPVVGMQIRGRWHQSHGRGRWRNTWSGWHGRWHLDARGRQGVLKFWVNFRGRESQVRFHRIPVELPLVSMGGFSILPWDGVLVTARVTTRAFWQRMLDMEEEGPWLLV